jgi:hypothetical protein
MMLPIKRFIDTPEDAETSHRHILFENFGVSVYYAQLFEGTLQNLLMGMELTGLLPIDRQRHRLGPGAEGLSSACIGQMIRALEADSRVQLPPDLFALLRSANKLRNDLIHRFLLHRADQIISVPGQVAVTDELFQYYNTLYKAHAILSPLCDQLLQMLGISSEELERRRAELLSYGDTSFEFDEET